MIIYLATDHAGFQLKEAVRKFLLKKGYLVKDFGAFKFNPEDDYPDFVRKAAEAVSKCGPSTGSGQKCRAVIFGGSGQGEAMVANRYKNVRAAVFYGGSEKILKLSREHNDANILSLGARFLKEKEALAAVWLWLKVKFSEDPRHKRRIKKIG